MKLFEATVRLRRTGVKEIFRFEAADEQQAKDLLYVLYGQFDHVWEVLKVFELIEIKNHDPRVKMSVELPIMN
jgi:hypothetical protein